MSSMQSFLSLVRTYVRVVTSLFSLSHQLKLLEPMRRNRCRILPVPLLHTRPYTTMKLKRWLALLPLLMATSVSAFVVQPQSFSMAARQPFSGASIRPLSVLHHSPETEVVPSLGVLDTILPHSPVFWSSAIMLSIVALLFSWEEAVKSTREKLPATLVPVVDSMLAEMSGLGFIGLFLGVVVTDGPLGGIVGHISERYLGNEEILLESFEFLHTAFFEVGVGFFLISGFTVAKVLNKISSLQDFSKVVFDTNEDGNVCLEELADVLDVDTITVDLDGDGNLSDEECSQALRKTPTPTLYEQLFITSEQVEAEALVVRERFLRTCPVSPDFRIETYFAQVFSHNLEEIVELSPLTWLPLIPALSLGRSVDLSRNLSLPHRPMRTSRVDYLSRHLHSWEYRVPLLSLAWFGVFGTSTS